MSRYGYRLRARDGAFHVLRVHEVGDSGELFELKPEFADGVFSFALSDGSVDSFINLGSVSNLLTGSSSRILRLT